MAAKLHKYAYTLLHCNPESGQDEENWEAQECRAFAKELYERFRKRTDGQYQAIYKWDAELGKSKMGKFLDAEKHSKCTIIMFSKNFGKDDLSKYVQDVYLLNNLHSETLFPVSFWDGKIPTSFCAKTPLKFKRSWTDDSRSWKILLDAICRDLETVRKTGEKPSEECSDGSSDEPEGGNKTIDLLFFQALFTIYH